MRIAARSAAVLAIVVALRPSGHSQVPQISPDAGRHAHAVSPAGALSAILYEQTSGASTASTNSQNFEPANDTLDDELADDFVVPGGQTWSVNEVDAIGIYYNGPGPAASFNVVIYSDSGTFPGTPVCTRSTAPFANVSGSFNIALSPACALTAGVYWVSVQANEDSSTAGLWAWTNRTIASNSGAAWRNPGNGFGTGCTTFGRRTACTNTTDPGELFALRGTIDPPTSGGLLIGSSL